MDYEAEYNNRARVPEHPDVIARWIRDAAAYRDTAQCDLDIAYGDTERMMLDLFSPQQSAVSGPLAMFIHGGYWQALDRKPFSHMARGLNLHGTSVAVANYDLCPAVSVADIIDEMRVACGFLWRRTGQPVVVYGHSAGGHLAAALLATNWRDIDAALPADLVQAAYAISGVFELVPLIGTSINAALGLDDAGARAASPALWAAPKGRTLVAAVGGLESREFLRQSRDICSDWSSKGVETHYREIEGVNHFTVLDPLSDPDSAMVEEIQGLVAAGGGSGA